MKIVTFSFDDGILQDKRIISILNKYGLKATFNLNSECLGAEGCLTIGGKSVPYTKVAKTEIVHIYNGHEIAAHSKHHPDLKQLSAAQIYAEVEEDRISLENLCNHEVIGFAYPGAEPNYNDAVVRVVRKTGVRYARTIKDTHSFELPQDFYLWNPTTGVKDIELAEEIAERFCREPDDGSIKLFYCWGHGFELDYYETWDEFETLCKVLSERSGAISMTNGEIYRHFHSKLEEDDKKIFYIPIDKCENI